MTPIIYLSAMAAVGIFGTTVPIVFLRDKARDDLNKALKYDLSGEEMERAEGKVSAFLSKNELPPGADILVIGEVLGIRREDQNLPGNTRLNLQEQTFVYAHKCGRIIDGMFVSTDYQSERGESSAEETANYIAAALLMPLDEVFVFLEDTGYWNAPKKIRIKIAKTLCRKYHVDSVMGLRRIREVSMLKRNK